MELENILALIKTISDSNLKRFTYEESGLKIKIVTDKEKNADTSVSVISEIPPQMATFVPENGNVIKSPLVGTFYASATPSEEPFVKLGDAVKKGQVLGIVEAMKLMNEIESDFDGIVKEILVSNEEIIEYGQPMFVIQGK